MSITSKVAGLLPDRVFCQVVARSYVRFEPELKLLVGSCDPHGVSVDVGSWFGPWTYWLSRRVERVIAIEANPKVADVLRNGVRPNVEVRNVAVSDHVGVAKLAVSGHELGQEGRSSLRPSDSYVVGEQIEVPMTTIDALELTDVRFMKVDVEGEELAALRGAQETITRFRPVVVAELEDRYCDVDDAVATMTDLGYRARVLVEGRWRDLDDFDLVADQRRKAPDLVEHGFLRIALSGGTDYVNNVVFVHPESTWSPW